MRCHARFHEYLVALLERLPPEKVQALRLAHGRLLADEGLHEEATEELLRAGAPEEAFRSARRAIFAVIERRRLPDRGALDRDARAGRPRRRPRLGRGRAAARGSRSSSTRAASEISDRLLERGEREALAASSERAAALMGWNYLDAARIEDFKAVLAVAPDGPAHRRRQVPRVADLQRRAGRAAGRPAADRRPVRLRDPDRRLPAGPPAATCPSPAARPGRSAWRRRGGSRCSGPAARRSGRSSSTRRRCGRCRCRTRGCCRSSSARSCWSTPAAATRRAPRSPRAAAWRRRTAR